jgi:hypothetical protein
LDGSNGLSTTRVIRRESLFASFAVNPHFIKKAICCHKITCRVLVLDGSNRLSTRVIRRESLFAGFAVNLINAIKNNLRNNKSI